MLGFIFYAICINRSHAFGALGPVNGSAVRHLPGNEDSTLRPRAAKYASAKTHDASSRGQSPGAANPQSLAIAAMQSRHVSPLTPFSIFVLHWQHRRGVRAAFNFSQNPRAEMAPQAPDANMS